jgi:hypothetical protein
LFGIKRAAESQKAAAVAMLRNADVSGSHFTQGLGG